MNREQYRRAIARLGLSQERAGSWLGKSGRTSQGWAIGEQPVPPMVAMLLAVADEYELSPDDITALVRKRRWHQ